MLIFFFSVIILPKLSCQYTKIVCTSILNGLWLAISRNANEIYGCHKESSKQMDIDSTDYRLWIVSDQNLTKQYPSCKLSVYEGPVVSPMPVQSLNVPYWKTHSSFNSITQLNLFFVEMVHSLLLSSSKWTKTFIKKAVPAPQWKKDK